MSNKFNFCYLLIKISIIFKAFAVVSVVDKGITPLERHSVAIRFFVDIENENRVGNCKVFSKVKRCCLTDFDEEDCDVINAIGETIEVIKPRDRQTLVHVLPTLCPYDLVGFCDVLLDYRCSENRDRLHVTIPFDTRIVNKRRSNRMLNSYLTGAKCSTCKTRDQNSLNNCSPINCDIKYSGQRSFYDEDINRCVKIPICVGDIEKELSTTVYDSSINICKNLENPLSNQDIYAISTGLGTITKSITRANKVRYEYKSNCSTISQNMYLLRDLMYGKLCPCDVDFENLCKSSVLSIVFCVISVCALLLSFLLCVNTLVWVYRQWYKGNVDAWCKKVRIKLKRTDKHYPESHINTEIKNTLLRGVITRDVPLELRDSVLSICNRMEENVRDKRRYRMEDIGSQISLQKENLRVVKSSSTETLCSEKDALIK